MEGTEGPRASDIHNILCMPQGLGVTKILNWHLIDDILVHVSSEQQIT